MIPLAWGVATRRYGVLTLPFFATCMYNQGELLEFVLLLKLKTSVLSSTFTICLWLQDCNGFCSQYKLDKFVTAQLGK